MQWEEGYRISVRTEDGAAVISANREGLLSLSRHLAELAEGRSGDHSHLDRFNALEEDSAELIIEKTE